MSDALRKSIIEHLRLLSNFDAQMEYERSVPVANAPAELFCIWFDDLYHPDTETFQAIFTPHERAILATFHQRFERVSNSLPDPIPKLDELHARME